MQSWSNRNLRSHRWQSILLLVVLPLLVACAENNTASGTNNNNQPIAAAAVTSATIAGGTATTSVTARPTTSGSRSVTPWPTSTVLPSVVLAGELKINSPASGLSSPQAELIYATDTSLSPAFKTLRLLVDETRLKEVREEAKSHGPRVLVTGNRVKTAGNEEALQVNSLDVLAIKTQPMVGRLTLDSSSTNGAKLLFQQIGSGQNQPLLIHEVTAQQLGDLSRLDGKRVVIWAEKLLARSSQSFLPLYVGALEVLQPGPIITAIGNISTVIADVGYALRAVSTTSSGYALTSATNRDERYYLVLPTNLEIDPTKAANVTLRGEKLVNESGKSLYGLVLVAALA